MPQIVSEGDPFVNVASRQHKRSLRTQKTLMPKNFLANPPATDTATATVPVAEPPQPDREPVKIVLIVSPKAGRSSIKNLTVVWKPSGLSPGRKNATGYQACPAISIWMNYNTIMTQSLSVKCKLIVPTEYQPK